MCDPAPVCTLALQYNRAVHKTEGTAEKLSPVAPGTRTQYWKHPQKWAWLNMGIRQQDVKRGRIPTKEAAEFGEPKGRTQGENINQK